MKAQRAEILPLSLPPLGVNREQAAALVGISVSLFDKAVMAGTMPKPRKIGGRLVYDVTEIAEAFRNLPHQEREGELDAEPDGSNPWDA
nr:transcriptional regulator [Rhizobium sp. Q54]